MKTAMLFSLILVLWSVHMPLRALEFNNKFAFDSNWFTQQPRSNEQHGSGFSLALEPEIYQAWDNDEQSLTFKLFFRYDNKNSQRTHTDIRELSWQKLADNWEVQIGISRVFWGVTESLHLVDIINQADVLENPDASVKLGQAMFRLGLSNDLGSASVFVLPGFRERDFYARQSRFAPVVEVSGEPLFAASNGNRHVDMALRWEQTLDSIDLGLVYFYGTDRNPAIAARSSSQGLVLHPFYDLMQQFSVDLQLTQGSWLWKLEALHKNRQQLTDYQAAVGGFEYTFYAIFDTEIDAGVLVEYQYHNMSDSFPLPGDNDIFAGLRLAFNDVESSELLLGLVVDPKNHGQIFSIEGSRRIGDSWKITLEGRVFRNFPRLDPLNGLLNDDYIKLELAWFYSST